MLTYVLLHGPLPYRPAILGAGRSPAASSSEQPLFIRLVEGTRHWLGPRPVALLENGWYNLADVVQQRAYWFGHTEPASLPPPAQRQATTLPPASGQAGTAAPITSVNTPSPSISGSSRAPATAPVTSTPRAAAAPVPSSMLAALPHNLVIPRSWPQAQDEGVWMPAGQRVQGQVALERTFVLPDPQRPYARVDLVWINPALAHVHVAAGTRHPRTAAGLHGGGVVPPAVRPRLLAAFNGGFKRIGGQYQGFGFRVNDQWYLPPSAGLATLAVYPSGRVVLGAWGRDLPVSPWGNIALSGPSPRDLLQNLLLLVDHGQVSPVIGNAAAWGETVNNAVRVWRSGLGQTASGDLIYAAGTPLTALTLAQVLQVAGTQRAMELDINSYWVTFNFYQPVAPGAAALQGRKLLPAMQRSASRYLSPDSRSFVYLTGAR